MSADEPTASGTAARHEEPSADPPPSAGGPVGAGEGRPSDAARPARRTGRAPALVVLGALLAAALLAGPPARSVPDVRPGIEEPVALPPGDVASSAWYCAGGALVATEGDDGVAVPSAVREHVTITNLGDDAVTARVTVMAAERDPVAELVTVEPGALTRVRPQDLSDAPEPGVIVEPFGGEVVVEQATGAGDGLAVGPCVTSPSSTWYLPAGTTVRGAQQWLSLFNPFGDDAIVEVTLATDEGRREPDALRGYVVPRRSRVTIPIHDFERRAAVVATTVVARTGRVAATQSLLLDTDDGRTGSTLSSGATTPGPRWVLAGGRVRDDVAWTISVLNPGAVDTEVSVRAVTDGDVTLDPVTLRVPRRTVGIVDVGLTAEGAGDAPQAGEGTEFDEAPLGRVRLPVPLGVAASIVVDAATGDVVVEELSARIGAGASVSAGVAVPDRRWVLGRRSVSDLVAARLVVVNPGGVSLTLSVALLGPDGTVEPAALQRVVVPAGARDSLDLGDADGSDGGILVTADAPVVVERVLEREDDVTRTAAIPSRRPSGAASPSD